jgi:hypothetical protein
LEKDGEFYTLRNAAAGQFKGYYLDINHKNGRVVLSEKVSAGCRWQMEKVESAIRLRSAGASEYKDHYLDINPKNGRVRLSEKVSTGCDWILKDAK